MFSKFKKGAVTTALFASPFALLAQTDGGVDLSTVGLPQISNYIDAIGNQMSAGVASALSIGAIVIVISAVVRFAKKGTKGSA